MFDPSSFCFGGNKPTAFRFPPGEESSIFVGSFLPFNRKPTSLGFAVGMRGSVSKLHSALQKSRRGGHWPSAFFGRHPLCGRPMCIGK